MTAPTEKTYRIVKLQASNVKKLKAVEILPDGNMVTIGGKNGNGKSSVLDAIMYALAGNGVVCEAPIRHGQTKAEVVVDLDDLIITKTFTVSKAPQLRVQNKDGSPVSSPQTILDQLCNKISFDPLQWIEMEPKKQLEILKTLAGVGDTIDKLEVERKNVYDRRTQINRKLDENKALLATRPTHEGAPEEEVSVAGLMVRLKEANVKNTFNANIRNGAQSIRNTIELQSNEIDRARQAVEKAQQVYNAAVQELEKMKVSLGESEKAIAALEDFDTTTIEAEITAADDTNAKVRENKSRGDLVKAIQTHQAESTSLTNRITAIEEQKEKLLRDAKFPLPGLGFNESGILLNGVPFNQASQAEMIRASVAIGLALNPKLRVILIRNGSLLDDDSMKLLAKTAEDLDAQVWIELVSDNASVVLEDGSIKES